MKWKIDAHYEAGRHRFIAIARGSAVGSLARYNASALDDEGQSALVLPALADHQKRDQLTKEYNMFTRRSFVLGAVYSTMTLASSSDRANAQGGPETPHKIPLKILRRTEYPGEKYACVLVEVDLDPRELVPRHMHPGVESTYLASGTMILSVQGQSDRVVKAGEGYQIPPDTPHNIRNGPDRSKIVSTLIVEKDKPMIILVPSKEFSNAK